MTPLERAKKTFNAPRFPFSGMGGGGVPLEVILRLSEAHRHVFKEEWEAHVERLQAKGIIPTESQGGE